MSNGIDWNQTFKISAEGGLRWQLGSLELEVYNRRGEYLVSWNSETTKDTSSFMFEELETDSKPSPDNEIERYVLKSTSNEIKLGPRTADRPVVIRPREPFILPSREETTLFVSTPLWIEIAIGKPPRTIKELPAKRPSDTWFGPSLLKGEVCYDSRTRGVLDLEHLDYHANRIITPLLIRNHAETPLLLERVSLPVPFLSIFQSKDKKLWTEAISMTREEDGEMAELEIGNGAPEQAIRPVRLAEPRNKSERNTLIRAFGGLFT